MNLLSFFPSTSPVHSHSASCNPDWTETYYIAEEDLEYLILLPPPLVCWNYRCTQHCMVYVVLEIEQRIWGMAKKYYTN